MTSLCRPLFSESTKSYRYKSSVDEVRLKIETVLENSGQVFSEFDFDSRFTGEDTFLIDSPVPAATNGVVYRSTLYGIAKPSLHCASIKPLYDRKYFTTFESEEISSNSRISTGIDDGLLQYYTMGNDN
jgi:hypothetical protein